MLTEFLRAKIRDLKVTRSCLDYEGSLTLDKALMEASNMYPYQKVQILDADNGARIETYLIEGGPGVCEINGPACHLIDEGDTIMVLLYGFFEYEYPPPPRIVSASAFYKKST